MRQLFSLNKNEKKFCLELARQTIESKLNNSKLILDNIPKKLFEKKACFVTLLKEKDLRGCVGHLNSFQELYKDVIDNSINSAFNDNRFLPLTKEDFCKTKIEISVLTDPEKINYSSTEDLLKKIVVKKDGLIIKKGYNSATFLPSVWEELPKKEDFLNHLCLKAGLNIDEWKNNSLEVEKYFAIVFKE